MIAIADQREMDSAALATAMERRGLTSWIYLGEDTTWRVRAEASLPPGIRRVSLAGQLDRVSRDLRQPYLDLIGSLPARNNGFA